MGGLLAIVGGLQVRALYRFCLVVPVLLSGLFWLLPGLERAGKGAG